MVLSPSLDAFYLQKESSVVPALPKAFGITIITNVVWTSVTLIILGTKVGQARSACKDKALKDGDKDAESRFSYPKLYAEGFSEIAQKFNCIQRGHQQALETYPSFIALSLVTALYFPITASIAGVIWNYARLNWADGYATGDPQKRYTHWSARGIWVSLIVVLFGSLCVCGKFFM